MSRPTLRAKWTPDCQGKQDFDATILELSTRYWPRGGGFSVLVTGQGWEHNDSRPEVKPHAHATIMFPAANNENCFKHAVAEIEVHGETEEEVKRGIEEWATDQFNAVVDALTNADELSTLRARIEALSKVVEAADEFIDNITSVLNSENRKILDGWEIALLERRERHCRAARAALWRHGNRLGYVCPCAWR